MLNKKQFRNTLLGLLSMVLLALPISPVWAHGGAAGTDTDQCRIPVGDQWVHFTAYVPSITGDVDYCADISVIGKTNLVFDYEGVKLRKMKVEYEVTREPGGERVFYSEPQAYRSGTINKVLDFNVLGAGKYLIHVALVPEGGEKVDAHIAFEVGSGESLGFTQYLMILLGLFAVLYLAYYSSPVAKEKMDAAFAKLKNW